VAKRESKGTRKAVSSHESRHDMTIEWRATAHHVSHPFFSSPMDLKSTHSTFFSRVYATPQSSNNPPHLSATRPQSTAPSFFGKTHTSQLAGRRSECHTASTIRQDGGSTSVPSVDTEDSSIYADLRTHRYFSRSIEGLNSRHSRGSMPVDEVSCTPDPLKSEPVFFSGRAGTLITFALGRES
jgi:hypothetical protein